MKLTSKIPGWIKTEMDSVMGVTDPIGIKLCSHSTDYISKDLLLLAHKRGELVNVEATCKHHKCLHWAKFKVTDAQARWLRTL